MPQRSAGPRLPFGDRAISGGENRRVTGVKSSNAGSVLDVLGRANSGPPFLAVAAKVLRARG